MNHKTSIPLACSETSRQTILIASAASDQEPMVYANERLLSEMKSHSYCPDSLPDSGEQLVRQLKRVKNKLKSLYGIELEFISSQNDMIIIVPAKKLDKARAKAPIKSKAKSRLTKPSAKAKSKAATATTMQTKSLF